MAFMRSLCWLQTAKKWADSDSDWMQNRSLSCSNDFVNQKHQREINQSVEVMLINFNCDMVNHEHLLTRCKWFRNEIGSWKPEPGNCFHLICLKTNFNLNKFNSIQNDKYCIVRDFDFSKNNKSSSAGIELGTQRLPVWSADHSAIRS